MSIYFTQSALVLIEYNQKGTTMIIGDIIPQLFKDYIYIYTPLEIYQMIENTAKQELHKYTKKGL